MIKIEENYKVETLDFDFDIGDSLGHIGGVSGILKYLFSNFWVGQTDRQTYRQTDGQTDLGI